MVVAIKRAVELDSWGCFWIWACVALWITMDFGPQYCSACTMQ